MFAKDRNELAEGSFTLIPEEQKEIVRELVACYHYRTGKANSDGSRGEINISPGQINDIIAYVFTIKG